MLDVTIYATRTIVAGGYQLVEPAAANLHRLAPTDRSMTDQLPGHILDRPCDRVPEHRPDVDDFSTRSPADTRMQRVRTGLELS